jgi:hypothetical protein
VKWSKKHKPFVIVHCDIELSRYIVIALEDGQVTARRGDGATVRAEASHFHQGWLSEEDATNAREQRYGSDAERARRRRESHLQAIAVL